jgi:uncharacterized protein YceH (UPF0502 family)
MNLSPSEIRVLGCLLEKQRTTPDAYPLSLNALRLACNQSTNRDPVVRYDEAVLRDALHRLERRGYTRLASGAGSRAAKYRHLLAEALPMGDDEQAVMCVLMLRGPQTPGELKQRTERMHAFADLGGVHATLEQLIGRGLAAVLERRPGQKEERYIQLLGEEDSAPVDAGSGSHHQPVVSSPSDSHPPGSQQSAFAAQSHTAPAIGALEERVASLEREVARLRAALGDKAEDGSRSQEERRSEEGRSEEASRPEEGSRPEEESRPEEGSRPEQELPDRPQDVVETVREQSEWT